MMASSLFSAIDALEYIEADYSGVDTAMRYAQGLDPRNYTNFEPLSDAMRAVERGKTIQEQDVVDQMAADIVQAILTLERKESLVIPTPTPSSSPTPGSNPTPTPYNPNYTGSPNQSNGVTLDQLQALLDKNKPQATPVLLGLPKTGDQDAGYPVYAWYALPAILMGAAVSTYFIRRKRGS